LNIKGEIKSVSVDHIPPGKQKVVSNPRKCVNCDLCMLMCSFTKEKIFTPYLSRIRIEAREHDWLKKEGNIIYKPKVCVQCADSPCIKVCPTNAIIIDEKTEARIIKDELCNMCLKCVEACPLDAIFIDKKGDRVLKCDVCNGEPQCVEWCPTNALLFITDKG